MLLTAELLSQVSLKLLRVATVWEQMGVLLWVSTLEANLSLAPPPTPRQTLIFIITPTASSSASHLDSLVL